MIVKSIDFEMSLRNCQFKLFHVIDIWLWTEMKSTVLACLNKFCAKMREFFCLRASFIVYRDACILVKIADVRCLKRLINALYHICRNAFLSIFFFKSYNFVECHIKTNFLKHCEITFRNLSDFLWTIMFLSLSMKA